jgi:hypothetical protein
MTCPLEPGDESGMAAMGLKRGVVSRMLQFSHAVGFLDKIRSRDLSAFAGASDAGHRLVEAVDANQAAAVSSTGGLSGDAKCSSALVGQTGTRIVEREPRPR